MKCILEIMEHILSGWLSVCACMGMFLMGCFAGEILGGELAEREFWCIFLVSLLLTVIARRMLLWVRYCRLELLAGELEARKDEQAQELYEHLRVT